VKRSAPGLICSSDGGVLAQQRLANKYLEQIEHLAAQKTARAFVVGILTPPAHVVFSACNVGEGCFLSTRHGHEVCDTASELVMVTGEGRLVLWICAVPREGRTSRIIEPYRTYYSSLYSAKLTLKKKG
jgi:hypothetical protein